MSKKIIVNKKIKKGFFYLHNDKNGGHPALIIWKNDNKNIYVAILFTHVNGPNRIPLNKNINQNHEETTYVHTRPIICKRRELSKKRLDLFKVNKADKIIIKCIKNKRFTG